MDGCMWWLDGQIVWMNRVHGWADCIDEQIVCIWLYSNLDNITLCTNLQNMTLSNMSHLIYITLYGETDGVILSRLDCIERRTLFFQKINVGLSGDESVMVLWYFASKTCRLFCHVLCLGFDPILSFVDYWRNLWNFFRILNCLDWKITIYDVTRNFSLEIVL